MNMDPYFQAIVIAQYQHELRAEAADRRRRADLRRPQRFGISIRRLVVLARTALRKRPRANAGESDAASRNHSTNAVRAGECVPRCLRLQGVTTFAACTPHRVAHAHGTGFHAQDR